MPTPLNWITDRLPTEADADPYGDVIVALTPNGWEMVGWHNVTESTPWISFKPADTTNFLNDTAAAVEPSNHRRIISITRTVHGATETIDAVADDGTAWWMVPGEVEWTQLPKLPEQSSS